jgi:hypothetical protein
VENPFAVLDAIWQTPRDDTYKSLFDHSTGLAVTCSNGEPDDPEQFASLSHLTQTPSPTLAHALLHEESM